MLQGFTTRKRIIKLKTTIEHLKNLNRRRNNLGTNSIPGQDCYGRHLYHQKMNLSSNLLNLPEDYQIDMGSRFSVAGKYSRRDSRYDLF